MKYILTEAFSALLFLFPVFRILNRVRFHSRQRTVLYFLFALYLAAVYHLTGLPTVLFITFDIHVNLIPRDIFGKELVLSLLNIAMFVPLGFFLPLLWEKYRRLTKTLLFGLGATVTIELAQLLTYRATDINDVITNSLGCLAGFAFYHLLRLLMPKARIPAGNSGDLWRILAVTVAGMFFLQPVIAEFLYRIT